MNTLSKLKTLGKDTILYGGLSTFSKFFSIFLTPIFTRLLTKEEYGIMDMLNPIVAIAGTLVVMGMDSAVARFYYLDESDKYRKQVISNGFWSQILVSIFVVTLLIVFKSTILKFYLNQSYSPIHDHYLLQLSLVILFSAPVRFAQNLFMWTYQRKNYVYLSTSFIVINFMSILIGLIISQDKLMGVFVAQTIANLIFAIISTILIRHNLQFAVNLSLLKMMLKYSIPLVILAFIPAIIPAIDRSVINSNLGLDEVANYGLGYRIATLVAIPISSINTALGPFILSLHKEHGAERLFNTISYLIILVGITFILLMVTLSPLIIDLVATRKYIAATLVVAPLSFYFLIDIIRGISASGIDLSMKTYWNLILYPVGIIVLIVLLQLLTPIYGIFGAAISLFLCSLVNFILFTWVSSRLYPFRYNIVKKTMIFISGLLAACLITYLLSFPFFYIYGIIISLLFFIFGFFIFTNANERKQGLLLIDQKVLKGWFFSKLNNK